MKNREELLARVQRFEEQPVPTYRAWASDLGTRYRAREAVLAMPGPQLKDGEAWLRRQLEHLGESTS